VRMQLERNMQSKTKAVFARNRLSEKKAHSREREFFTDNLLVRIHFIIEMIRWTGLAPWEFEFPFPGSLTSTFLVLIFPSLLQLERNMNSKTKKTFDRNRLKEKKAHSAKKNDRKISYD